MTWRKAAIEWVEFLETTSNVRSVLRCSWSSPWFRGHSNSSEYELVPSLFRQRHPRDEQRKLDIEQTKKARAAEISNLKKQLSYARRQLDEARKINAAVSANSSAVSDCKRRMERLRKLINEDDCRIRQVKLIPTGEREAFIEYSARSGKQSNNSWETLAEMQHSGIPTRLLDWSETLSSALFFALKKYLESIEELWRNDKKNKRASPMERTPSDILSEIAPLPMPSIWILNPFRLSERATDRTRIWDLTRQPEYDYFQKFIVEKDWSFDDPIPMYSPWRNPRIAAQQGTFLAWGRNTRSLDKIVGDEFVREIKLTELAAVYGSYVLSHILAIDHFSLFRDSDSLARALRDKYMNY